MKTSFNSGIYFADVGVNIHHSGVLSEVADVCIVPQYATKISFSGVCASLIHSPASNSICAYQDFIAKHGSLSYGEAYAFECNGDFYRYLIHISVLGCPSKNAANITKSAILAALRKADELNVTSVVLPAVNTGKEGRLTYAVAAKTTFEALEEFAENAKNIKNITLALYKEEACEKYWDNLAKLFCHR